MSAQPIWITPSGSLGTIAQGSFYQLPLQVTEPDGSTVYFEVIAGALPSGIECTNTGVIQGVPTNVVTTAQEATIIGVTVVNKFAIRAYTTHVINGVTVINRLADRTFTLTIAGEPNAQWITPAGSLGQYFQGELLVPGIQLKYTDDPLVGLTPLVSLVSGSLPAGLTISETGVISGVIGPNPVNAQLAGFARDYQGFDKYGFDFDTYSPSYNFSFTLKVTDGVSSSLRDFSMYVWTPAAFDASTTYITADNTYLTASASKVEVPVIKNPQGSIGTATSDTFFAYQFLGQDLNNDTIGYRGANLPPGLRLDPVSGWLYGYLGNIGLSETTYSFYITPYQYNNPAVAGSTYKYTLTIAGPISSNVTWITPSNLGTINNGETSIFSVVAKTTSNVPLQYRLRTGSNSTLPQGLKLLPSGNIVGRVSFNTFALDNGTTTFDNGTTTFDMTYTFTVNAYSSDGTINVNHTFTILVVRAYNAPYNNLYIKCMPPQNERYAISSLLGDASIFTPSLLYRADDPNFGVSSNVTYYHAYGLTAANIDTYTASLELNHYWKNLILGEIKTARAVDPVTGNVIYEVVYSEIIDTLVNNEGVSVGKQVVLPYPLNNNTQQQVDDVYPNALVDMREQVIDVVGQESNMLPLWMLSKQSDGNVLGFTPAWVIAYTIPNESGQIAYNLETQSQTNLNLIEFKADRYELDNSMTVNWDSNPLTLSITNLTSTGTSVTVSYATQLIPPFAVGDQINIDHVVPSSYNGTYFVTACTTTHTTFSSIDTDPYIVGGTIAALSHWSPIPSGTTFDINYHYDTTPQSRGVGYAVGDKIKISGAVLGGTSPANDLIISVTHVTSAGSIAEYTVEGTASILANGHTYHALFGTNIVGHGAGAQWNMHVVPGRGTQIELTTVIWTNNNDTSVSWNNATNITTYWTNGTTMPATFNTLFDGGSTTFNAPADINTNTDAYDKYLLFPKQNIIENLPGYGVIWLNDYSNLLNWVNNLSQAVTWIQD